MICGCRCSLSSIQGTVLKIKNPICPPTFSPPDQKNTHRSSHSIAHSACCYQTWLLQGERKRKITKGTPITGIDFDELTPSTYQKNRPLTSSTEARICMVKSDGSI